ncbi:MAG: amino acid ABC transporter substrate-binding protein [Kiritimatiellae bacterium]|nr:amino acid ABC transporter substrate-binding protein [Kiritimatiellia bacterium]
MRIPVILALVAIAGCSDRSAQSLDQRIADSSRPLVLVTYPTDPPCSYVDETGTIVGTDIDLARRIAAKLGRGLVVEGVRFNDIIPRLKAGTADLGIATIIITEARQRDVDFSTPYGNGGACFLYRKDGKKPRMSRIATFRIAVEADSVHDLYLCFHGCDPMRYNKLDDAAAALERNEVDAIFFDSIQLVAMAENSNGQLLVTPLETKDIYGVAVDKRRPDVLSAANAVIEEGGVK